jgi:ribosomal protein S18 acetylase RimI-like enzyme
MKTNIRIATIQDIEQIVPLLISLDDHHVNMYPSVFDVTKITVEKRTAFLSNNINEPNNLFLIAEINTIIVGVVHCYIQETKNHPIKKDKKVAVLSDLYVDEQHRNKGIASQLINASMELIKQNWNIESIYLNVFNKNEEAIKLYEKLGFQQQFSRYSINMKDKL